MVAGETHLDFLVHRGKTGLLLLLPMGVRMRIHCFDDFKLLQTYVALARKLVAL